jgi:hypothetical protein
MNGITLSEEERKQIVSALELGLRCALELESDPGHEYLPDGNISRAIALLTRDQPPEVCECGGGVEPLVISDGVKLCGHCGLPIKETT